MASPSPLRLVQKATAPSVRRSAVARLSASAQLSCRSASTLNTKHVARDSAETPEAPSKLDAPRWARTPPAMVAPIRARPLPPNNRFEVNEDPKKLDEVFVKLLGNGGEKALSEDTKWLAVTHKSFDHGRRGYNDRLVFLGKRIVDLQTSLALIDAPQPRNPSSGELESSAADEYGRTPFTHPQLSGLSNLSRQLRKKVLDEERLAPLAKRYGLAKVVRWKPRVASNLEASGEDTVLAGSLYAIIGAISLERGGEVANRTVKEKILAPLGL